MDGRTIVWIAYGAFVGWMLNNWYRNERDRLMWAIKDEATMAVWRLRDAPAEAPAQPEVAVP